MIGFAGIAIGRGDVERGTQLLGGVEEILDRAGAQLPPDDALTFAALRATALQNLREARFTTRWAEGAALDQGAILALATAEGAGVQHRAIG